jgi:glucuronoarabinoxylan endo-1,4-beta-xylanase
VSARNVSYNGTLAPGATTDIGSRPRAPATPPMRPPFTLNGIPCTVA